VPRAVVDPNVLISAAISPDGTTATILTALGSGRFELIVNEAVLDELNAVLARDEFRRWMTLEEAREFVASIRVSAITVSEVAPAEIRAPDGRDQYLVDLTTSSACDVLVSGDPHLLGLRTTLPVVTPRTFLDLIGVAEDAGR